MDNYNIDCVRFWFGGAGESPVPLDARVTVQFRDGEVSTGCAGNWRWDHKGRRSDIVAFVEEQTQ